MSAVGHRGSTVEAVTTPQNPSATASTHTAHDPTAPVPESPAATSVRRVAVAAGIGTAVELYDFIIYGLASAIVLNKVFFTLDDPLLGTLVAFATMGVGFLARPLGGIVFGHFGDRLGRKRMLVLTLTATGLCTALIGCIPAAATWGMAAPILVLLLRLCQGFFMGGEQGGAFVMITEHAPAGRKSFFGGFATAGSPLGSILGTLAFTLATALSGDAFLTWGWRVPFWLSLVLVAVGLYIRLGIDESPEFKRVKATGHVARLPLGRVLRTASFMLVAGILVNLGFNLTIFIVNSFSMAYGTEALHMDRQDILTAGLIGSVAHLVTVVGSAWLADKLGLTRVMATGAVLMLLWAFPFFWLFDLRTPVAATIAIAGGYAMGGVLFGPMAHWFTTLFAPELRYSGVAVSYNIGAVLGGGLSPTIATWLLSSFGGQSWPISLYLCLGAVFAVLGLCMARGHVRQAA
nr:MFS transporter [Brevibacterium sp. 91QC2O2]